MTSFGRSLSFFAVRWAVCVGVLWGAGVGLHLDASRLGDWQPWLLAVPYRLAEIASSPFSPIAAFSVDLQDDQYSLMHFVVRFGAAAAFFGTPLALVWQALAWRRRRITRDRTAGSPEGTSRRKLLTRAGLATAGVIGGGLVAWPTGVVPNRLIVRRFEVAIRGLPAELDGLRLAHLSDTHFGPYVPLSHIRRAVELASAEDPDLAVLTGDYVYRTPRAIERGIGAFAELRTRHGSVAVLGNHDHWEGAEPCRRRLAELEIPLLDNDRLWLTAAGLVDREEEGHALALMGVGDLMADVPDPTAAGRDVSPDCPRLLVSHNPDVAEVFPEQHPTLRVDLQLSGHTHGGQVRWPGGDPVIVPGEYGLKYAGGLIQGPRWPVIVSRGVGMAIAPLRLGVTPEIGVITLRRRA